MKKEVNSVLGIVMIILVSALICFLTMFIVDDKKGVNNNKPSNDKNVITDNNTNEDKNDNQENEVKYEKIENIDVIAKEFYDRYIYTNRLLLFNYNNVFKNGNRFNVSDLSSNDKMLITYGYIGRINMPEISADEFKNTYVKLFGTTGYQNINFGGGFCYCQAGLEVVYDANSNKFIKKASIDGCGGGPDNEKYLYDKAEQLEDKINIYVKVGYMTVNTNDTTNNVILYNDFGRNNIVASNINGDTIESYKDKLNTLIYTLVKDTSTNNYVLESIEVVK